MLQMACLLSIIKEKKVTEREGRSLTKRSTWKKKKKDYSVNNLTSFPTKNKKERKTIPDSGVLTIVLSI